MSDVQTAPSVRVVPTALLATVALSAAIAFMVGFWTDDVTVRLAAKPLPVVCMLVWLGLHARDRYAWLIAFGLVFSLAGDIFLEVPQDLFVFGLSAFLVAHLFYVAAALFDSRKPALLLAIPFLLWTGGIYLWLFPSMGGLAVPVAVYVTVICAMLWRMAARTDTRISTWFALAGAISFAVSDSIIAIRKFDGDFTLARESIMVLYWLGQAGITASVVRWGRRTSDRQG